MTYSLMDALCAAGACHIRGWRQLHRSRTRAQDAAVSDRHGVVRFQRGACEVRRGLQWEGCE